MGMESVLVTGASGYIAQKLISALSACPDVRAIIGIDIRPPARGTQNFHFVKLDVREPLTDLFREHQIDTVVHTAFVLPPIHDTKLMEDINVNGTRNVLFASLQAGVKQFLYTSSTTAYGFHPDNICPLTEDSPLRGNDDLVYSKTKKEIERIFVEQNLSGSYPDTVLTILRVCFVVGPAFDNPLARYLRKRFVFLPVKTQPLQYVHEDDLVRAMILLLRKRRGGVYNIAGDGLITFDEMVRLLGNTKIPLPFALMYFLNRIAWGLRLTSISEFPSPTMNMLRYPWWAENSKLKKDLGFRYQYTTRTAFRDYAAFVAPGNKANE
jgi:UDP-glucose 4-epimerase